MSQPNLYACARTFFCAHCAWDRGGGVLPVFPAPSLSREGGTKGKTRTNHVARMRMHIFSVVPAKAGTQYAAAYRFYRWRLWNTGSPALLRG